MQFPDALPFLNFIKKEYDLYCTKRMKDHPSSTTEESTEGSVYRPPKRKVTIRKKKKQRQRNNNGETASNAPPLVIATTMAERRRNHSHRIASQPLLHLLGLIPPPWARKGGAKPLILHPPPPKKFCKETKSSVPPPLSQDAVNAIERQRTMNQHHQLQRSRELSPSFHGFDSPSDTGYSPEISSSVDITEESSVNGPPRLGQSNTGESPEDVTIENCRIEIPHHHSGTVCLGTHSRASPSPFRTFTEEPMEFNRLLCPGRTRVSDLSLLNCGPGNYSTSDQAIPTSSPSYSSRSSTDLGLRNNTEQRVTTAINEEMPGYTDLVTPAIHINNGASHPILNQEELSHECMSTLSEPVCSVPPHSHSPLTTTDDSISRITSQVPPVHNVNDTLPSQWNNNRRSRSTTERLPIECELSSTTDEPESSHPSQDYVPSRSISSDDDVNLMCRQNLGQRKASRAHQLALERQSVRVRERTGPRAIRARKNKKASSCTSGIRRHDTGHRSYRDHDDGSFQHRPRSTRKRRKGNNLQNTSCTPTSEMEKTKVHIPDDTSQCSTPLQKRKVDNKFDLEPHSRKQKTADSETLSNHNTSSPVSKHQRKETSETGYIKTNVSDKQEDKKEQASSSTGITKKKNIKKKKIKRTKIN